MKIFDRVAPWPDKVNFVDDNNVVVGYDMDQSCCERAGWYISTALRTDIDDGCTTDPATLGDYDFDPKFFEHVESADVNEGGMVRFRLVRRDAPWLDVYLHIFNSHNGYYSHGFTFTAQDKTIQDGSL